MILLYFIIILLHSARSCSEPALTADRVAFTLFAFFVAAEPYTRFFAVEVVERKKKRKSSVRISAKKRQARPTIVFSFRG
jgi:hypothetical protein